MLANSLHTTLNLSLSVLLRSRNPLVKFELFHQKFSRGALCYLTHFCYLHSVLNDHFKFPYWVILSTKCKKGFPLKKPSLENYIPIHSVFSKLDLNYILILQKREILPDTSQNNPIENS